MAEYLTERDVFRCWPAAPPPAGGLARTSRGRSRRHGTDARTRDGTRPGGLGVGRDPPRAAHPPYRLPGLSQRCRRRAAARRRRTDREQRRLRGRRPLRRLGRAVVAGRVRPLGHRREQRRAPDRNPACRTGTTRPELWPLASPAPPSRGGRGGHGREAHDLAGLAPRPGTMRAMPESRARKRSSPAVPDRAAAQEEREEQPALVRAARPGRDRSGRRGRDLELPPGDLCDQRRAVDGPEIGGFIGLTFWK